jgi:hypothetical protein
VQSRVVLFRLPSSTSPFSTFETLRCSTDAFVKHLHFQSIQDRCAVSIPLDRSSSLTGSQPAAHRPLPDRAFDFDVFSTLLDDAVDDR